MGRRRKGILNSDLRDKFRLGYLLFATGFILAGIFLFYVSSLIPDKFWSSIFNQLSIAIMISSFSSVIYESTLRQDFVRIIDEKTDKILEEIGLVRKKSTLGLIHLQENASRYDYSTMLLESKNLVIVLNKGSSWYSSNSDALGERFKDPSKKTEIFFLDPNNNSEALTILSRKENLPEDNLKIDINNTIGKLKHIVTSDTKLTIYGHKLFNP